MKTTRNGQPWYVPVSGVYASKEEAKKRYLHCQQMSGPKPVGETAASGTGRSEVIKVISRNGLSLRELPEALDAVGAFSTAGEGVIS